MLGETNINNWTKFKRDKKVNWHWFLFMFLFFPFCSICKLEPTDFQSLKEKGKPFIKTWNGFSFSHFFFKNQTFFLLLHFSLPWIPQIPPPLLLNPASSPPPPPPTTTWNPESHLTLSSPEPTVHDLPVSTILSLFLISWTPVSFAGNLSGTTPISSCTGSLIVS